MSPGPSGTHPSSGPDPLSGVGAGPFAGPLGGPAAGADAVGGPVGGPVGAPLGGPGPVRYLWVLRHGKAASEAPSGGGDRERPLAGRGRRDATALGKRLAGERASLGLPDTVPPLELALCSSAVRTRQTADRVAAAFGGRLPVEPYRSLYAAATEDVLGCLRQIDDTVRSALLVGHNPTMFELVWELLAGSDDEPGSDRSVLEVHGFPTCALAVLGLWAPSWAEVAPGCASLEGLLRPPY